MNDAAPEANQAPKRSRAPKKQEVSRPAGEVTYIDVPHPPHSAINKNRPISDLIKAHLQHVQHAEHARLPKHKRSGVRIEDIHTEAEAANYIREITHLLHPQRRKKSRARSGS